MRSLKTRFVAVLSQIKYAELANSRKPCSVKLLAVSKTKPAEDIIRLYHVGQRHFGESYLQESLTKQRQLGAFNITWHFIGPIQSNKTKALAAHFNWVHSVDRLKIANRLSEQRPKSLPPLNICLQVNISEEQSKSGVSLDELPDLIKQVEQLPNIILRGVMAIPSPQTDYERQRKPYRLLNQVVAQLNNPKLTTFSYGMSGDLRAAIAEGATIIRVGTALFGKRNLS